MARRSLQASTAGIQQARRAYNNGGWTQEALAEQVNLKTRQPISKFLSGKSVDRHVFIEICTALELNWADIAQQETTPSSESSDLDALVQTIREQIKPLIEKQCGTMKVLDMTQPIALTGEQGIYTNVNILEKITGRKRLELEKLLQGCNPSEFDRLGLSRVTEERVPGLKAVERYSKLMVLGKPGAGKTTFLKYLAMQCIEDNFQADRIPIFITLKDFAEAEDQPDLLTYIEYLMTGSYASRQSYLSQPSKPECFQPILQQGKLLILLDGLDEVREDDTKRILRQIRHFSDEFQNNLFVITCRIAAKEYIFETFVEVEIADFDNEQITTFVNNWFRVKKDLVKAVNFLYKLEEDIQIQELASSPLLLTLLCLVFGENASFPTRRAELYKEGLDILLKNWDANRNIEREQIYKQLSVQRKEDLLGRLALATFQSGDYFFRKQVAERHIVEYIRNLPSASTDVAVLQIDSEKVLRSIEAQHGLLIERAKGIYSFSHLTFHEYFTARETIFGIEAEAYVKNLAACMMDARYREVLSLALEIAPSADRLLLLMKEKVESIIGSDEHLQKFLLWIHIKSSIVEAPFKPASIRALYLTLDFTLSISINLRYDLALAIDRNLITSRDSNNQTDDITLDTLLFLILDSAINFDFDLDFDLELASQIASNAQFRHLLRQLKVYLPGQNKYEQEYEYEYDMDWKNDSKAWIQRLKDVMIQHRYIGYEWQFNDEQKQLLRQYYDTNKLLVDCLNSDCYVSREVRQEIEDTLLLPIAEIEKYKATKAAQQSN